MLAAVVTTQLPESYSYWQRAGLGLVAASLYLILLVARELLVNLAIARGKMPAELTVFALGGVSRETEGLVLPNHELLMAGARFLSNLVIASMLYGFFALSINAGYQTVASLTEWMTYIWAGLLLLNFLPGYPLDAGMVLRALLLKRWGSFSRAGYISSTVGWAAGLAFIFSGVLAYIFTQQWLIGMTMVIIGWCLQSAARVVRRQAALIMSLKAVRVGDIMTCEYVAIGQETTVGELLKGQVLVSGWRFLVVTDGAGLLGTLPPQNLKSVRWGRWNNTRVGDIMIALEGDEAAYPAQTGANALQEMDLRRMDALPVVEGGRVIGVVTRERLLNLGRMRAEFGR
jgi:CBS domain-containing protein